MLASGLVPTLLLLASPPALRDHFPDPGPPGHDFLLVDGRTGEVLRAEGRGEDPADFRAWGDLERLVGAMAGLEDGTIDPERRVRCDSTCWAAGTHGEVALVEGLAWGCDTWWGAQRGLVSAAAVGRAARSAGLAAGDAAATGRSSPAQWATFWRRLEYDELGLAAETTTQLLAVAGTAVSSPRGSTRLLHDPYRRTRAIAAGGPEGAWVIGSRIVLGRNWVFALFVPGGTPPLATARAQQLLDETRRIAHRSTAVRGGVPVTEPE
jgi:hypothetical protein